ncbi:GTP cyclohydrolase I FolE [Temperatibacter marinus]|uniref:GTP cyclohydrolase 1 n=1 Tax=Temperatibacter marinus TaxID=1456591 RepID=A0AA52EH55_9PROT|nr:GTP cyclohydrolase I FolE [Temperatibacter marinus]WND02695.1 GTP cyclohydrolase I FolE [Temperatibacter marinus]
MDAVLERSPDLGDDLELKDATADHASAKPTREEAEEAVRTLLRWAGENPEREGLLETPKRVTKAYLEFFKGYSQNPHEILSKTFEEVEGYNDMVVVKDIPFESHCEHHMVPIIGKAHVAYMPNGRVVGLSKLARTVDLFAKRLQVQEKMTAQIADAIEQELQAEGVAVVIDAAHHCMTMRGVHKHDTTTVTHSFRGCFNESKFEKRFWRAVQG